MTSQELAEHLKKFRGLCKRIRSPWRRTLGNLVREWNRDTVERLRYEAALAERNIKMQGRLSMARTPKSKAPAAPPQTPPGGAGFPGFPPQQPGSSPFPGAGAPGQFPQQVPGQPPAGFPQQGQPSPFGAPPPGFPPAPTNGAPGPFGAAPDPAAGFQQLAAPVNQQTVQAAMQQAGAGVTSDPAIASAISAINGSLKDLDGMIKDLQTKLSGAVSSLAQSVVESNQKLDAVLAALHDGGQAQQAPAPQSAPPQQQQAAPASAPQQQGAPDANAILNWLRSQIKAKYDAQPGQYLQANNQQVWAALATMVKTQFNIDVQVNDLYNLFQANNLISQAGAEGATYILA